MKWIDSDLKSACTCTSRWMTTSMRVIHGHLHKKLRRCSAFSLQSCVCLSVHMSMCLCVSVASRWQYYLLICMRTWTTWKLHGSCWVVCDYVYLSVRLSVCMTVCLLHLGDNIICWSACVSGQHESSMGAAAASHRLLRTRNSGDVTCHQRSTW